MRPKQPLKVLPNPFGVVDHNGQPVCAVMMHQGQHVPQGTFRYVGAKIVHAIETRPQVSVQVGSKQHVTQQADHDRVWVFDEEPVDVPFIPYYVDHITRGDLIAADKPSALRCGITNFEDPKDILARAKEAARKSWDETHGDGDFALAEQERAELLADLKKKAEENKPVAAATPTTTPTNTPPSTPEATE